VSSIQSPGDLIQCVVDGEALDSQLDSKAAIAERLPVRALQQLAEGLHQTHHVCREPRSVTRYSPVAIR
jgi:hypothetical protein